MKTTRRQLLGGAAAAASLLCMPAIATRSRAQSADEATARLRGGEILPTPNFAQLAKTAQFAAGVRPHRRGGVRLSLEPPIETASGRKFVIHNYGHSGAGITLSWGCASKVRDHVKTVVDQLPEAKTRPSVAILGAGVIGLTVAAELRRQWRRLPITLYAKNPDVTKTTSFIAGGQFEPSLICNEYAAPDRKPILEDYLRRSAARIREFESSGRQFDYGIVLRRNYTLDDPNPAFDNCTPRDVVAAFTRGRLPFRHLNVVGREYITWLMNPKILLPKLIADLGKSAVLFKTKDFQSLQQVHDLPENIIINCTGYGAKRLFNDPALRARRGHLVVLRNPARLKYLFSGGCSNDVTAYLFARQSDIVIGGTIRDDDERDFFDPTDSSDKAICNVLLRNAEKIFDGHPDACASPFDIALK